MPEGGLFERLYRSVIRMMPADYRARFGDEMSTLMATLVDRERPQGRLAKLRWQCGMLLRGTVAAAGMHWDRRRRPWSDAPRNQVSHAGAWTDLRYALRSLRSSPWYTVTVVLVLAVPVTMASTTFAIVDGVLFRPLPYPESGQLVALLPNFTGSAAVTDDTNSVSETDLRYWRGAVPDVPMTGARVQPFIGLGEGVNESAIGVARVEANFFDVMGVRPLIGGFSAEDFAAATKLMPVVITYDAWQGRFEGADVLGREIIGNPGTKSGVRIVGVMPPGFTFPSSRWDVTYLAPSISTAETPSNPLDRRLTDVVARLPPGLSDTVLRQRLQAGAMAAAREFPAAGPRPKNTSEAGWRRQGPYEVVDVQPLAATLGHKNRSFFRAVFAAVALLVLLAALNVSSLMAARALDRSSEINVRRSLGARTYALARLWLVEALALMVAAGALTVAATPALLRVMTHLLPEEIALLKPAQFDWRVGGFIVATLLVLTAIVTVAPIRRSLTAAPVRTVSVRMRTPGRFLILSGQVFVAVVLTVVGSMLVGSLLVVYAEPRPIRTEGIIAVNVMLSGPGATMSISAERAIREQAMRMELGRIASVRSVGASSAQVLAGGGAMSWFEAPTGRKHPQNVDAWSVSEGFYDVLEPELIAGRLPGNAELRSAAPVVVVSADVARSYWPNGDAIGNTLIEGDSKQVFTVIGIVREVRWSAWDTPSPVIYAPYQTTSHAPWITYFLRTSGNSGEVVANALRAIERIDPLARIRRAGALDEWFRDSVSLRRFQSWLFGSFALASLIIVGAGILGLLAMSAARRSREVGIRCALGATRLSVLTLLFREQLTPVLAGLVLGAAAAAWAVRPLRSYLYQITPADPRVWTSAILMVIVTAAVGTLLPALRASRIDPSQALRKD